MPRASALVQPPGEKRSRVGAGARSACSAGPWRSASMTRPGFRNLPRLTRGSLSRPPPTTWYTRRGERPVCKEVRLGSTTSLSKPPHDRTAVRPEADTARNRPVRSLFTSPERRPLKHDPLWAPSNSLNYRAFNISTKMAVVRLRRRKWAERDEKRPEMGLSGRVSVVRTYSPRTPAFCGVLASAGTVPKKNVPLAKLAVLSV